MEKLIKVYPQAVEYDELFNVCCIAEDKQKQQRIITIHDAVKHVLKDDIKRLGNDKDLGAFIRAKYK